MSSAVASTSSSSSSSSSTSSSSVSAQTAGKRGPFAGWYFVCDLDGTLVQAPRQTGTHPPLNSSPACMPVLQWLRSGGSLAVVSTAGTNLFRQILQPLLHDAADSTLQQFAGDLVLCGWSGAVMFRLQRSGWESAGRQGAAFYMKEEQAYRKAGGPGGSTTCIGRHTAQAVRAVGESVYRCLFALFAEDPQRVRLLSPRYRDEFARMLAERQRRGAKAFDEEVLSAKQLATKGAHLPDTALMCFQAVPRAERHSSSCYSLESLEYAEDEEDVIAQISLLGVPFKLFDTIFDTTGARATLEQLGCSITKQPNSVAISRQGVCKASAIAYMLKNKEEFGVDPVRTLVVGDQPATVDATMMRFTTAHAMPFFSVGRHLGRAWNIPDEVRRAIDAGGVFEFAEASGRFFEHGTAFLFQLAMSYIVANRGNEAVTAISFFRLLQQQPQLLQKHDAKL